MANFLAEVEVEQKQVVYEHKVILEQIKKEIFAENQDDDLKTCLELAQEKC